MRRSLPELWQGEVHCLHGVRLNVRARRVEVAIAGDDGVGGAGTELREECVLRGASLVEEEDLPRVGVSAESFLELFEELEVPPVAAVRLIAEEHRGELFEGEGRRA